jgi:hypothetical protein
MIDNDSKMDEEQETVSDESAALMEEIRDACRSLECWGLIKRLGVRPGKDGRLETVWGLTEAGRRLR